MRFRFLLSILLSSIGAGQTITTVAGSGTSGSTGDGSSALTAILNQPTGIAVDSFGNLYIADRLQGKIRRVNTSGIIQTYAGNGSFGFTGDNGLAVNASFLSAGLGEFRIAVDNDGNLYITDDGNNRIRKVDTNGKITTIAGGGIGIFSGDNGPAVNAGINKPSGIAVDGAGNIYFAETGSARVRRISTAGIITTVAGNGGHTSTGDGGPAINASFDAQGIAVDPAGNIYIAEKGNYKVRKVSNGIITTFAGKGDFGFSGDGGLAVNALLKGPMDVAVDALGNVYIADESDGRIRKVAGPPGKTPSITSGTVANGATYVAGGLVPGSFAQLKGADLANTTRIWQNPDFFALGNGLPTNLSGTAVRVNGVFAAVYFISATQVSFQVPANVSGNANIQVIRDGQVSNTVFAAAVPSSPGIFPIIVNGRNFAGGVFLDGKFVGDPAINPAFRKARPGDVIQLFATGLAVSPAGTLVSTQAIAGVTVKLGDITFPADAAALVAVGEFQINFTVPQQFASLPESDYPITIQVNGVPSPAMINGSPNPDGPLIVPIAH